MLGPNATSAGEHPRNEAALTEAGDELVRPTARLVWRPDVRVRLVEVRRDLVDHDVWHCVPPGPSKNTSALASAVNCAALAPTSRIVVLSQVLPVDRPV